MSVQHVIMCDGPGECITTAEAWPRMAGYRLSLRKRGWYHDPVTDADYCPRHNPVRLAALAANGPAIEAAEARLAKALED